MHDVRNVRYHVREWGDRSRPVLALLHGWGDSGASFQFVVDELGDDFFVIAPDWRGFGDTRLRHQSYWFPDYIADLDALRSRFDVLVELRGRGLMLGLQLRGQGSALALSAELLAQGYITLAAGASADVLQLSPPLNLPEALWKGFVRVLAHTLERWTHARSCGIR